MAGICQGPNSLGADKQTVSNCSAGLRPLGLRLCSAKRNVTYGTVLQALEYRMSTLSWKRNMYICLKMNKERLVIFNSLLASNGVGLYHRITHPCTIAIQPDKDIELQCGPSCLGQASLIIFWFLLCTVPGMPPSSASPNQTWFQIVFEVFQRV